MYSVGDKIIYGENGVCTIEKIGPLPLSGGAKDRIYYSLRPLVGSGTYYAPVDTAAYMRPENEDDDGYDPWSDRREDPPLFEPDPWG